MERKKTLTMNWAGLGDVDEDEDHFFETVDRLSSAVPADLASSGSDNDDFEDSRMSFTVAPISSNGIRNFGAAAAAACPAGSMSPEYDIWMAAPGSITERRKRLFQDMGLSKEKELLKIVSQEFSGGGVSNKLVNVQVSPACNDQSRTTESKPAESEKEPPSPLPTLPLVIVRSRSDTDIESFSLDKKRREDLLGLISKQCLTRTSSVMTGPHVRIYPYQDSVRVPAKNGGNERPIHHRHALTSILSNSRFGAFFLIKNLDTGKEFVVNENSEDGTWNKLRDLETGKKLTLEEFEKCVGHSPVVKEAMRRTDVSRMNNIDGGHDRKMNANSYISKSLRMSKRRGAALLKNIRGVANSMTSRNERDREIPTTPEKKSGKSSSSEWVKVRQSGKSYKELTALHLCQEIHAHEGSIWTIKFNTDGRFLASAGEDRVIHVWEVQECEILSFNEGNLTPVHPSLCSSPDHPALGQANPLPSEKRSKGKGGLGSRKGNQIPDYVHVPETVFSLSEKPFCSFQGHLDEVLDLCWSRSQRLLSSSMDKTVRLWDLETKSCLNLFAHNDYVTCIQFNPIDDNYFISGSLDAMVRIWSIPDRQVVNWTDFHEMVTAACYTPNGQGAVIGSQKGTCRMYSTEDCALEQLDQLVLQTKKKAQGKKITGFQFSPANPSEVLVTAADSRIRILDGSEITHKFRGFRNTNSQISASYSLDGKYIICASEDSQVYVWKREEQRNAGKGKSLIETRSHEHFPCKDVSVAIPWPGTVKGEPPPIQQQSKRHPKFSLASHPPSACGSPTKEDHISGANNRRHLLLSGSDSPTKEDNLGAMNNKRQLPPLPKKNNIERTVTPNEEELAHSSCTDSGIGSDSFNSNCSSPSYGDSPSISSAPHSSSWSSSWFWLDGSSHGSQTVQATAWGLVIVTATLGGEIRAYQNFGLPRKLGRQANLF